MPSSAYPLLVKERVREGQERINRRLFMGFALLIPTLSLLKERVAEERGGVRSPNCDVNL